jgi:hypothetical protein
MWIAMPPVRRLRNATLYVYANDHAPPHFHILGPSSNAMVDIETLQVIRGRFDRRDLAEAIAWAAENLELLRQVWRDLND